MDRYYSFCPGFEMSIAHSCLPFIAPRIKVLLISSKLKAQARWSMYLKDMAGVNFKLLPRQAFLTS